MKCTLIELHSLAFHRMANVVSSVVDNSTCDHEMSAAENEAADFLGMRQNQVTIGNYFKHLMMYDDRRFAKHPQFRFFALNIEMQWRALQIGRIYVRQHPSDAQLSLEDLLDKVGRGETFSHRVLRYSACLCGTRQYWFRQYRQLMAMFDTFGLPTIFFTHSSADLQWPSSSYLPRECTFAIKPH